MREHDRLLFQEVYSRCNAEEVELVMPWMIHSGTPISTSAIMSKIDDNKGFAHGAIDLVEGAVWRCERKGKVDFLGKYVRPDKVDGAYLESVTGKDPVWNWQPS
jgi:hypothetical protein